MPLNMPFHLPLPLASDGRDLSLPCLVEKSRKGPLCLAGLCIFGDNTGIFGQLPGKTENLPMSRSLPNLRCENFITKMLNVL